MYSLLIDLLRNLLCHSAQETCLFLNWDDEKSIITLTIKYYFDSDCTNMQAFISYPHQEVVALSLAH